MSNSLKNNKQYLANELSLLKPKSLGEIINYRIFVENKIKKRRDEINPSKFKVRKILEDRASMVMKKEITVPSSARTGGLCMGVHAPWSKGKTLALVFFAKRRNEDEGLPVVANFRISSLTDFRFLDEIEILKETYDSMVAIDEIRRYMDSYMSRGAKARFVSNLTADIGKQNDDLYYSDQHFNAAPPRLKVNLSIIAEPDFDEESSWVTLYLYQSIEDYIYKNQFFYFGFYGPDFWKYYDTHYKVEDYKIKFKVERYANEFLVWVEENDYAKRIKFQKDLVNLWNQAEGTELTASEAAAVYTYLKLTGEAAKLTVVKKVGRKRAD